MSKLRLHLEDLQVDSFDTDGTGRHRGTVFGLIEEIETTVRDPGTANTCTFQTGPTCPECPFTYAPTCRRTCQGESCDWCPAPTTDTQTS
jgi:hypothetical protein